jgi:hypothetical protein
VRAFIHDENERVHGRSPHRAERGSTIRNSVNSPGLTFRERLREEEAKAAAAESADPWRLTLERVRGRRELDSLFLHLGPGRPSLGRLLQPLQVGLP